MILNDIEKMKTIDIEQMYDHLLSLPDQLSESWNANQNLDLHQYKDIHHITICGMGGSAIGADLMKAYVQSEISVPVEINRDYTLPAWVKGPSSLVITSSHSGNTEETLSCYSQAVERGCQVLVLSTGGRLSQLAAENGHTAVLFNHQGQPRAAVGFSFGYLLAILYRLGLFVDQSALIEKTVNLMKNERKAMAIEEPLENNPAKQLAQAFKEKLVYFVGAEHLVPVSRRWKGQVSEVAKSWGQFEDLPEMDHNTLAGTVFPKDLLANMEAVFFQSSLYFERNQSRLDHTVKVMEKAGIRTTVMQASGESKLEQIWSIIQMGDYAAYYLAMLYGVDPTEIPAIMNLKEAMSKN